jgi:hypothetical protein
LVAKPLGEPRFEDNIKTDVKGKVCEGVEWFKAASALGPLAASSESMNLRVPLESRNF